MKAMTLIPLALGVLGLKAWNALQLSFFSFITAFSLAIFQLCKKVIVEYFQSGRNINLYPFSQLAADSHHPQIAAHGPWDHGRSFAEESSSEGANLAYNAYA
jgi:hypothetical protein